MLEPMPLDVAVRVCFPHGGITKSTLLAAIRKGALGFEKVGRTYLVTAADIAAWREKCREEAKGRVCSYASARAARPCTSSGTDRLRSAQAAALMMSQALTRPSRNTSQSISGPTPENVISLELQSRKS